MTVAEIQTGLRERRFSAAELCEHALEAAATATELSNSFLTLAPERARAAARRADERLARGEDPGPLAGVAVAVKDVIVTRGLRTTCGSRLLENYLPPYDATAVERVEAAGGMITGKTNCDEFAMGSSNENSAFGPVKNPRAMDRVPGGSSGGSAAALAEGAAVLALGSDTGGSVRQPAAFCGVVGVTPTYGRVSRYGLTAFASSLDHIGPMARTVEDAAILLGVIAGADPRDATCATAPVPDYRAALDGDVRGWRLGVPREWMENLPAETGDRIAAALDTFTRLGCVVREIRLPTSGVAIDCYYILCTAEASSNLARYAGVRYTRRAAEAASLGEMYRATRGEGFGAECKRRIMLGTYVLSHGYYDAYYLKAQKVRTLIARDFARAFAEVDAIVGPVSPTPAFRLGEKTADPLEMYLADIYTVTGSLAGIPCMSVPCGETPEGLPVGLQIAAAHFAETTMLKLAHAFEQASA
jgi:aspartyl-tRNA(Asn)/glutamyl-tRNA(Gln) amidotransferase subunit A